MLEGPAIARKSITKWNLLALLVAIAGGAATLYLDQLWLQSWAASGVAFPIFERRSIELPAGVTHVWYESRPACP